LREIAVALIDISVAIVAEFLGGRAKGQFAPQTRQPFESRLTECAIDTLDQLAELAAGCTGQVRVS
jgi:hypothetical protein